MAGVHSPAAGVRVPGQLPDRLAQARHARSKRLLDAAHEHFHAAVDADEQAPARAGLARGLCPAFLRLPAPEDDAAVVALHIREPGHGGGQAEGFRVRGVDAADERLRDTLQDFPAQPSSHERCKALVAVMGAPGYQRFQRHAQLAAPGEHGTLQHRSDPRGGHQQEPLGEWLQRAPVNGVEFQTPLLRRNEAISEAQALTKA